MDITMTQVQLDTMAKWALGYRPIQVCIKEKNLVLAEDYVYYRTQAGYPTLSPQQARKIAQLVMEDLV